METLKILPLRGTRGDLASYFIVSEDYHNRFLPHNVKLKGGFRKGFQDNRLRELKEDEKKALLLMKKLRQGVFPEGYVLFTPKPASPKYPLIEEVFVKRDMEDANKLEKALIIETANQILTANAKRANPFPMDSLYLQIPRRIEKEFSGMYKEDLGFRDAARDDRFLWLKGDIEKVADYGIFTSD